MDFCMCWGVEAPFVRNSTHTHTHTHTFFLAPTPWPPLAAPPPPSEEVFLRLLNSQMNSYGPGIARSSTLRCSSTVCWTTRALTMTTSRSSAAACWHTPVPRLQPSRRLHQQPTGAQAGAPSGVQAGDLVPPVLPGRTGAPSPLTAPRHCPPSTSEGEHPSVPFGTGPYARPRHCVTPTQGRNLDAAFAAEEDSPPRDDLFAALDQADTRRENAADARDGADWPPRPWSSMGFGATGGDQDAASEVSMGVSESEMYRARVAKRRLDDRSPRSSAITADGRAKSAAPAPPMTSATDYSVGAPAGPTYSAMQV